MLGTRKGLVVYAQKNGNWKLASAHFEGIPVTFAYADGRNNTWWACVDHGHWGVKLHRSTDEGLTWQELPAPAYPEGAELKDGKPAVTKYLWALANGGDNYPERLWLGTIPGGLFRSDDGGQSFHLVESLWNHPTRKEGWLGGGFDQPGIHSIVVDPRDNDHLFIGISCAGVFESIDAGETWHLRNKGLRADFLPDPSSEVGQDPHILKAATTNPDIMWQQNHCGIFMTQDGAKQWQDVSEKEGPANFGFALAIAEDNPMQAWVAPAHSDVSRVAIDRKLCICRTDDGGKSWLTMRKGLPQEACFDIVYRHGMDSSGNCVAFGTTTGNLFHSDDKGESWSAISHYLPMVHSVMFV